MITDYLATIILIFALAIAVIVITHKLKLPGIIGFLITGIVAGPFGLGIVGGVSMVEILAEIGVIFLLFTIGMQFSFSSLFAMKKIVLIGGGIQVIFTVLATAAILKVFDVPLGTGIFFGYLVCHSSTAIALKIYQDRAELESPHGRVTVGMSLFQDIITIPMLLSLPLLAGRPTDITTSLASLGISLVVLVVLVLAISTYIIPRIMKQITNIRSSEVFLISIILICFVIVYLSDRAGLSLALGAFLAGLTLSESEYFHQAFASILPFKDIFTSFFFISIGMLLNIRFVAEHATVILILLIGVLILKTIIAAGSSLFIGQSLRTSVLAGLGLSNVGEFAFILSLPGLQYGFFTPDSAQEFFAVAVMSMALAPIIITAGPDIADRVARLPLPGCMRRACLVPEDTETVPLEDHVIVIGYGLNGRNLVRATTRGNIPTAIIDLNPETVATEKKKGHLIFFGDATNPGILEHAGIGRARILVIVINDPISTRAITQLAREMNPHIFLIVRTRFITDVKLLKELGADLVIPEEFETSIEIFTQVLRKYLVPIDETTRFIHEIRSNTYRMLRQPSSGSADLNDLSKALDSVEIFTLVARKDSPVICQTLAGLDIRRKFGVSILAIRRSGTVIPNPDGDVAICEDDHIITLGKRDAISRFAQMCSRGWDEAENGGIFWNTGQGGAADEEG
jgi:monovalent cation:H+ antiporter-2, CPA2 family